VSTSIQANTPAILVEDLEYRYGDRLALDSLSLQVDRGQIFSFLGPNGCGKTTLFRILSTLLPIQKGNVQVCGLDVRVDVAEIRKNIGVIFQAPSIDKKLSVKENVRLQAALYRVCGDELARRESFLLERFGLADRWNDRVESLSGGLRRRCELAKCLIHSPKLLLLDEPSTGLDPGARIDLWNSLKELRDANGATIILTTHLLEEADKSDRIAIMDSGKLIASDTPDTLRGSLGGNCVTIESAFAETLSLRIRERFQLTTTMLDGAVRVQVPQGPQWVNELLQAFPDEIRSVTLAKPSLEDVFIAKTGHRMRAKSESRPE